MIRPTVLLIIASLLLVAADRPQHRKPFRLPAELEPFIAGSTTFAFDLHRRLAQPGANLIFSPYSLTVALALAESGGRGPTAQQIAATLNWPTLARSQTALASIRASVTEAGHQEHTELATASGLWAQQNYGFGNEFLQGARENFAVEVHLVDFASRPDATGDEINSWTRRQTRGLIQNTLLAGTLSADTRLVFVNTLYFKGQWASRFLSKHTQKKSFHISPQHAVPVPMMRQTQVARYAESEGTRFVELPYVGGSLSMVVLLPQSADGLMELEQRLSWNEITNSVAAAHWRTVDLELPRFKISSRLPLEQSLAALGLTDAFDPAKADFTGMSPRRPLWIDSLQQCAIVEVNEEGTVAAAATSGGLACSAQPQPATFHADHPFLFLIRDNRTGAILFLGRVTNPFVG